MAVHPGLARLARRAGALASAAIALAMTSCGGTDVAGVGSGGTGIRVASVSYGSISGFGSVIVNGVRFDNTGAALSSDGGSAPGALALGMVVEVRGDIDSAGLAGTAEAIKVVSEARGAVADWTPSGFTLLGLAVRTTVNTVYEDTAAVANGDYVEVYGLYDRSAGAMTATRIERKTPAARYKVRGTVGAFDSLRKRFQLGALTVDFSTLALAPAGLASGAQVRVHAGTEPVSGVLAATRIDLVATPDLAGVARSEIEGVIDRFVSLSDFSVDGVRVNGTAAVLEGGLSAELAVGRRVEVDGSVQSGVVHASKIEFESEDEASEFELKGLITDFVDLASFSVRAVTVDASGSVVYEGGRAADLRNGVCIEVKGILQPTAAGSKLLATEIHIKSSCS